MRTATWIAIGFGMAAGYALAKRGERMMLKELNEGRSVASPFANAADPPSLLRDQGARNAAGILMNAEEITMTSSMALAAVGAGLLAWKRKDL